MKKFGLLIFMLICSVGLFGCNTQEKSIIENEVNSDIHEDYQLDENTIAENQNTTTENQRDNNLNNNLIEMDNNQITNNTLEDTNNENSLVIYFSPTGNTKRIATYISEITNSDIIELMPEIPYTSDDLNYNNDNSRANQEQNDLNARPDLSADISLDGYNKIYIGYPIWRGTNPKLILTLVEKYNFAGKEIILFCTSGGSGIETSVSELKGKGLNIIGYKRFSSGSSKNEVEEWLNLL